MAFFKEAMALMGAEQLEAPLEQSWIDFMLGLIAEPTSSSPSNAASEAADTATCPASVVDDDHPLMKAAHRTGTDREMWDALVLHQPWQLTFSAPTSPTYANASAPEIASATLPRTT